MNSIKVYEWAGDNKCQLCGNIVKDKIYDAYVSINGKAGGANVCEPCYQAYHIYEAKPFVWDKERGNFIKKKKFSDEVMIVAKALGITPEEAEL